MSYLEFFASAIASLAWPGAFITAAVLFRDPLGQLLRRLRSARGWGAEAEFENTIEQAEIAAAELQPVEPGASEQPSPPSSPILTSWWHALSAISPHAAIINRWPEIDEAVEKICLKHEITHLRSAPTTLKAVYLKERNLIDDQEAKLIFDLRKIRDAAAHRDDTIEITPDQAVRFNTAASILLLSLERAYERA